MITNVYERKVKDILSGIYNNLEKNDIQDIAMLKKGMTNRSYIYLYNGNKYILRVPGEGTVCLIDRHKEYECYEAVRDKGLCDNPIYINAETGYKITRYIDNARTCNPYDKSDIQACFTLLKCFHNMKLKVEHFFDIYGNIEFYQSLWGDNISMFNDYETTKRNVYSLKSYIDDNCGEYALTHIDAVPDNFLMYKDVNGESHIQLTDWEYAGMQDPHVDIAMFCIYNVHDKTQIDYLIDLYFEGDCGDRIRAKIYCYISACGLLWSNWCEYKRQCGVEFGEYALSQYRYAKEFYRYAINLINNID